MFCVTGTVKAHDHGLPDIPAALLGVTTTTTVGGGMLRDLLAARTPAVLRYDQESTPYPRSPVLQSPPFCCACWPCTFTGTHPVHARVTGKPMCGWG